MSRLLWWLIVVLLVALLAWFWIPKHAVESRGEVRAALDIGSGATNLKVARVDPQTNKIISQIWNNRFPFPIKSILSNPGITRSIKR